MPFVPLFPHDVPSNSLTTTLCCGARHRTTKWTLLPEKRCVHPKTRGSIDRHDEGSRPPTPVRPCRGVSLAAVTAPDLEDDPTRRELGDACPHRRPTRREERTSAYGAAVMAPGCSYTRASPPRHSRDTLDQLRVAPFGHFAPRPLQLQPSRHPSRGPSRPVRPPKSRSALSSSLPFNSELCLARVPDAPGNEAGILAALTKTPLVGIQPELRPAPAQCSALRPERSQYRIRFSFGHLRVPPRHRTMFCSVRSRCVGELEEVIISEVPSTGCGRPC